MHQKLNDKPEAVGVDTSDADIAYPLHGKSGKKIGYLTIISAALSGSMVSEAEGRPALFPDTTPDELAPERNGCNDPAPRKVRSAQLNKRRGRVYVDPAFIIAEPEKVAPLFAVLVPRSMEWDCGRQSYRIEAVSERFEIIPDGVPAPEYNAVLSWGDDGAALEHLKPAPAAKFHH